MAILEAAVAVLGSTLKRKGAKTTDRWSVVIVAIALAFSVLAAGPANAFDLTVVDENGNGVWPFRYLLEEDNTHPVTPGTVVADSLSLSIHNSHAPVEETGHVPSQTATVAADPTMRHFVSVLAQGYSNGGAPVPVGAGTVQVRVHSLPLPTAQITAYVFHDIGPIDNEPGSFEGQEQGLEGFVCTIEDEAAQTAYNAYGDAVGTTYGKDSNGVIIVDNEGLPESVETQGDGFLISDADGVVIFKNLWPGKYGVNCMPPGNTGAQWQQTSTMEGKKTIDAWVKPNEPPYFAEFGRPGPHAFFGFIQPFSNLTAPTGGEPVGSLSGQVVNLHTSRPPLMHFFPGEPGPTTGSCWVALNDLSIGGDVAVIGLAAQPCGEDGKFLIENIPPGQYQLVVFDQYLQLIVGKHGVEIPAEGGEVDLGEVQVFQWFGRFEGNVFYDANENGFRDSDECDPSQPEEYTGSCGLGNGMFEQAVLLRFRDGTIYQEMPTDLGGASPMEQVFPFFHWLVAEVDFARFKATGATFWVDGGGEITDLDHPFMNLQKQMNPETGEALNNPNTGNPYSRTEMGAVLTQGIQLFLGSAIRADFGKSVYAPGENGGISGVVMYATTRAEDDPWAAAGEEWEPGIPRVQINLYEDMDEDGHIDDTNIEPGIQRADVDNHPQGWSKCTYGALAAQEMTMADCEGMIGPEDVDRNDNNVFEQGDAVRVATTDSWDDNKPTGCPRACTAAEGTQNPFHVHGDPNMQADDCFEGLRTYNQARPAVFDGGYAFGGPAGEPELPVGTYIVEAATPPGYLPLNEEGKNVDFGDTYTPSPLLLPSRCVGDRVEEGLTEKVPSFLTLFPSVEAPYAGEPRPLCNQRQVTLHEAQNAAADFFMYTEVPRAARVVGFVLDDLSNEFDQTSPQFGEKYAPKWIPVSIRDWDGHEVVRTYTDEFGQYNALLPGSYTVNVPSPTGVSPRMMTVCLNDPGPDPLNPDPYFNPMYSQFCNYTFQFWSGRTTYLDTPVVPVAAHAGADQNPLDCRFVDGVPGIERVDGPTGGPVITSGMFGQQVTITSQGEVEVPNPLWNPDDQPNEPANIKRDYGFGANPGTVTVGDVEIPSDKITSWTDEKIEFVAPEDLETGTLLVRRGDNDATSNIGVTLTAGDPGAAVKVATGGSIQDGIDLASEGGLVLVEPGVYVENVILYKNLQLQGYGAGSTVINGANTPAEHLLTWQDKMNELYASGDIEILEGQVPPPNRDGPGENTGNYFGLETGVAFIAAPAVTVWGNKISFVNKVRQIGDWKDGDYPGYAHAAPAGDDRLLVVMAHAEANDSATDFSGITYGGIELTQAEERLQNQGSSYSATSEIWYLKEADIATASGAQIVANASTTSGVTRKISSVFYSGVDQGNPIATTGHDGENANDEQTLSVTLSGPELDLGDMVVANATSRGDQSWGSGAFNWQNGFEKLGESTSGNPPYLSYSDASIVAQGDETATVVVSNNGVGALAVAVLNHNESASSHARVDGFRMTGTDNGGAAFIGPYAKNVEFSNNTLHQNQGLFAGGIRLGVGNYRGAIDGDDSVPGIVSSENENAEIHHNHIYMNGGTLGVSRGAGGIAVFMGADDYSIRDNYICGNFSGKDGAGIGHFGLSEGGVIKNNVILFNEAWNGTTSGSGGGIFITGDADPVAGDTDGPDDAEYEVTTPEEMPLTAGTGSLLINANLIQGNSAGTGSGGGIRLEAVNGKDVEAAPDDPASWHQIVITNNMIVNNVAGYSGAVSLQDALQVKFINNTVAHNDSTATAEVAFSNDPNYSNPQPAGLVAHANSLALEARLSLLRPDHVINPAYADFSNPTLVNNIHWKNRSFAYDGTQNEGAGGLVVNLPKEYWDLAVVGSSGVLDPQFSVITDVNGYNENNTQDDPDFVTPYLNQNRNIHVERGGEEAMGGNEINFISTAVTFDESGNWIDIAFGPLHPLGDYHIRSSGGAWETGADWLIPEYPSLGSDIEGDRRMDEMTSCTSVDVGADEIPCTEPNCDIAPGVPLDNTNTDLFLGDGVSLSSLFSGYDGDGDGVDDDVDDCLDIANADQRDTNQDGYGNQCDPDLDDNHVVNFNDVAMFIAAFGSNNEHADFNGDGQTNYADVGPLVVLFGGAPGPAGQNAATLLCSGQN